MFEDVFMNVLDIKAWIFLQKTESTIKYYKCGSNDSVKWTTFNLHNLFFVVHGWHKVTQVWKCINK